MTYIVKVGRDGFTEEEIKAAMKAWNDTCPQHIVSMDADFDGIVDYMKWSWRDFPADKVIEETDGDVWLRRGEIDCQIAAYFYWRKGNGVLTHGES